MAAPNDIFLYSGEPNPNDIKLRDPTVLVGGGSQNVVLEFPETVAAAEALARAVVMHFAGADTASGSDGTVLIAHTHASLATDTTAASDSVALEAHAKLLTLAETVTGSDAAAVKGRPHLTPADTAVTASDAAALHAAGHASTSHTTATLEQLQLSSTGHLLLELNDGGTPSDAIAVHAVVHVAGADTTTASDGAAVKGAVHVSPTDTTAAAGVVAFVVVAHQALADTGAYSDAGAILGHVRVFPVDTNAAAELVVLIGGVEGAVPPPAAEIRRVPQIPQDRATMIRLVTSFDIPAPLAATDTTGAMRAFLALLARGGRLPTLVDVRAAVGPLVTVALRDRLGTRRVVFALVGRRFVLRSG